jgi:hypothetical protein
MTFIIELIFIRRSGMFSAISARTIPLRSLDTIPVGLFFKTGCISTVEIKKIAHILRNYLFRVSLTIAIHPEKLRFNQRVFL